MSFKTSYNVLSHSRWELGVGSSFFGGEGFVEIRGGGVVKKRQSPDVRSPEVDISVTCKDEPHNCDYLSLGKGFAGIC